MSEVKKKGTIKDSIASAFNTDTGETESTGVGVSIPKDVWENFLTEIRARNLKIHIVANGPQITKIELTNANNV